MIAVTAGELCFANPEKSSFHVASAGAEPLLQRLDGVQKAGNGWRARCPACGGKSRKLSIAESDNRVLVNCFSCTDADAVLAAVGLCWADLQPPRHWPLSAEEQRLARRAIREAGWAGALSVLALEAKVVQIAAVEVTKVAEVGLSVEDFGRLKLAVQRIDGAANVFVEAARWKPEVTA
jgi:hypothetical protein